MIPELGKNFSQELKIRVAHQQLSGYCHAIPNIKYSFRVERGRVLALCTVCVPKPAFFEFHQ
jgi:hypothetical protein